MFTLRCGLIVGLKRDWWDRIPVVDYSGWVSLQYLTETGGTDANCKLLDVDSLRYLTRTDSTAPSCLLLGPNNIR